MTAGTDREFVPEDFPQEHLPQEAELLAVLKRVLAERAEGEVPGLFITFEGGDGSGKTTQAARIARLLQSAGIPTLATRQPGGTQLGQALRDLVMHGPEDVDPHTEALLYAADRAYHVANVVRPALQEGKVVLLDRYIDSSVAYQGAARDLGPAEIRGLSQWATGNLYPQVTVLFDLDAQAGLRRTGSSPDRLERSGTQFHEAVRAAYLEAAASDPERFVVVDAQGSVDEVYRAAVEALVSKLGGLVSP